MASAPPTYEEAILVSASKNSPSRQPYNQHQQHQQQHHPNMQHHQTKEATHSDTSHGSNSITARHDSSPSEPNQSLAVPPRGRSKPPVTYLDIGSDQGLDTPAIIIHSALSTPGDDPAKMEETYSPFADTSAVVEGLDELPCEKDVRTNGDISEAQEGENVDANQMSERGDGSSNTRLERNDVESQLPEAKKDVSSKGQNGGVDTPRRERAQGQSVRSSADRRYVRGKYPGKVVASASDYGSSSSGGLHTASVDSISGLCGIPRGGSGSVEEIRVDIHGDVGQECHGRLRDLDQATTASDPLLGSRRRSDSTPREYRPRNSSMTTLTRMSPAASASSVKVTSGYSSSSRQPSPGTTKAKIQKQGLSPCGSPSSGGLMPAAVHKISKSYNDLSGRQTAHCGHDIHPSDRLQTVAELKSSHRHHHHNKSSCNINERGDGSHHTCHKHHLIPGEKTFHGGRGMRSASADDVRMRNGAEEYTWKDGKLQLKNGGMTHAESVRYVWKDGHVEKITTDANEETQVEILETTESKTCSRINPVFVCVLLIAIIAVVIIVPVYYST